MKNLSDAFEEAASNEQRKHAERVKAFVMDLQVASYDHARTYTTVVIFGGYAGLFTAWGFTRELLPTTVVFWVALLTCISLLTFVMFEVYAMISRTQQIREFANLLIRNLEPDEFLSAHEALTARHKFRALKIEVPVWWVSVAVAVTTGGGAGLILLYMFIRGLFSPS